MADMVEVYHEIPWGCSWSHGQLSGSRRAVWWVLAAGLGDVMGDFRPVIAIRSQLKLNHVGGQYA